MIANVGHVVRNQVKPKLSTLKPEVLVLAHYTYDLPLSAIYALSRHVQVTSCCTVQLNNTPRSDPPRVSWAPPLIAQDECPGDTVTVNKIEQVV
jgi:hypothetical protein